MRWRSDSGNKEKGLGVVSDENRKVVRDDEKRNEMSREPLMAIMKNRGGNRVFLL